MQIYIHRNNQQLGPFTEEEIKAQLAAGTTSLHDNVWWEGQAGWVPLGQTPFAGAGAPVIPATPGTPYPVGAVAPSSKLAMWALIAGCLSLLCGLFASIPAIILGHMGLGEIKKNPGLQGRGMALAGVILGYVFTALLVIYIIAVVVLISMGSKVQDVFKTINSQMAAAQAANATNSTSDQSATNSDSSTNSPAPSTNAPASTPSDSSTTNASASTNAAPANP